MKILLTLIIGITFIFAGEKDGEIGFSYGFLSKPTYESENVTILSDSSVIHSGEYLKINVGYLKETNMCVIYNGVGGEYLLLFPDGNDTDENEAARPDTLYEYPLHWTPMEKPPGNETFYFINSINSLADLTKLVQRYENAPPKGQAKLALRIQEKIDALNPDIQDDLDSIVSQLDKPKVGGVSFRGEDDENLKDISVTHQCSGTGGIAFQKIVLIHK